MTKSLAKTDIQSKVFTIRGQQVMLDRDLAALYGVETKHLNEAVKRNIERFPPNFMFRLTREEAEFSRSRFATLNNNPEEKKRGQNIKYLPYAFTEQGVAMLSSVLKSKRAIAINIEIMNTFVAVRQYALKSQNDDRVATRLGVLEKALLSTDKRVDEIIQVLNTMLQTEEKEVKK
jgi:hypothetical protein